MKNKILLLVACVVLTGCTDDAEAERTLNAQGFSNISIDDRGAWFSTFYGCSDSDTNWYSTTADNPKGKRVNVTVCCGGVTQFKGCTIRTR